MQVLQSLKNLKKNGLRLFLGQRFHFLHVVVQVAIGAVLQPEHDVVFSFKGVVQVDQVFVFDRKQNALFVFEHF
jgi:hypothetical protein